MNVACYLSGPPKGFEMYKSMIVGLNTCRLAHSLRENPVICEDWIKDFWENATTKKGDVVNKSKVQGKEVSVSEQDIHEVLLFGDEDNDPVEYPKEKVMEVLVKMSYEGACPPPTIKKLLHPYWRFLAHIYLVCISGNKIGLDVETKYQNKRKLEKFGAFAEIQEEAPAQINAIVAEEHDVEIIEAPVGTQEPVENVDLTGVESEEDIADDRMIDDDEVNDDVDETETETLAEGLTAEPEDVNEPVNLSPPHVEQVITTETVDVDHPREEPAANLPPRK
ncbi:hypothetical protein HanOQP8_Chr05g0177991 [Helianthus annuus]|nr:hypothetical protein HanOQP8_Chr05g0177991 [Helianthus annuus]